MSYQVTKNRVLQYIGIILIIGVFAGAYWYFKVYAGVKTNALSPTGSLTSGLVGYWPFDRVSVIGTTSLDRSTSKYNGSLSGGPTVTSGQIGQALNFDGSDDFMSLGSSDYLNVNATADMTISGWFFRDTFTTDDVIVAKIYGIGPGETGYGVYISSGDQLIFKIGDGVQTYTVTTSMTFTTSVWTHFSIVWDQDSAANTKIYINGQSVSTSTSGTISDIDDASYSHTFRVGALSAGGEPFDGKIDEVRVYNRTLTANEVLTLYSFTGIGSEVNSSASQPQGTGRLDSGLAGYWKLDEGSGTSAADSSTNANTGTLTNGPTWTTGQIGSAVDFDGTNDYITMGDQSIHEGMAMMALSGWIKMDALPASNYFVITKSSAIGQYRLAISSTGMPTFVVATTNNAWYSSGTTASGTTALTTSAWTHLLGTYDGQYVRLYVNGVLVGAGSQAISGNIVSSTSEFRLSYDSYGNYFNGQIDEVRLYSRALSADEVADLYRLTSPTGTDTSLKGYWSFNGRDVSGTTAYDRSGAGNNGTLTNGPTVTPGKVGQALDFDGTNDYVTVADSTALSPTSAMTVSFWANVTNISLQCRTFLAKNTSGGRSWFITTTTSGAVAFYVASNTNDSSTNGTTGGGLVSQNSWVHIVSVFDGSGSDNAGRAKVYVNGVQQLMTFSGTVAATLTDTSQAIRFGESAGGCTALPGSLDEVRIYNTALSAAQIQSLYKQGQADEVNTGASQAQGTGRLDSGLAGYWKLDDGSGTSATDSSTNANTGTLTNGPTWTTGQIGGAVNFDGSDDYVNTASDIPFTDTFTFSAWFYTTDNSQTGIIFGEDSGTTGNTPKIGIVSNNFFVRLVSGGSNDAAVAVPTSSSWNHLVVTRDSSNKVDLYVNGGSARRLFSDVAQSATYTLDTIGANGDTISQYFNGKIDEVRVYNRPLSSDEVADLYRLTSPTGVDTSLKGYWSFNGQDISGTTAYDRSGAGNTGTLTNGPTVTPGKVGQALNFDGSNDYVDTGTRVGPSSAYSNCLWVKPSSVPGTKVLLGAYSDSGGVRKVYTQFFISGSGFQGRLFDTYSGGFRYIGRSVASGLVANQWSFLCMTWDGGTTNASIKLYRDGVQVDTTNDSNGTFTAASTDLVHFWIGAQEYESSPNNPMSGQLDEVRIYNRALTEAEIKSLYNSSR